MLTRKVSIITAVFAVLTAGAAMAQAYRWVDANGTVHYSDKPQEGAEEIVLPESTRPASVASTTTRENSSADASSSSSTQGFSYNNIQVSSPAAEETLWNIEGVLEVNLDIQPALQAGHQLRVYFDGEPTVVPEANFLIHEVYRGAHNIQAEILDQNGELMGRSQPRRFYVQQNTVNN